MKGGNHVENLTCEDCDKQDETVKMEIDPYQEDVNGGVIHRALCPECLEELQNDI